MQVKIQAITKPLVKDIEVQDFPAYIARIAKIKDNPDKLIKFLLKHKHWSPFEHTFITFKIETSRAIGRELLRHRSFTFQELSQRYIDITKQEPIELRKQCEDNRQSSTEVIDPLISDEFGLIEGFKVPASVLISQVNTIVKNLYAQLIENGVAKECARFILPECTSTTILMTGSLRSWIHFLELRDDPRSQMEAQIVAREIKKELIEIFPNIFTNEVDVAKSEV
jgi:thymidylate synthase (FAD)